MMPAARVEVTEQVAWDVTDREVQTLSMMLAMYVEGMILLV